MTRTGSKGEGMMRYGPVSSMLLTFKEGATKGQRGQKWGPNAGWGARATGPSEKFTLTFTTTSELFRG
jgi:hypothetical protein